MTTLGKIDSTWIKLSSFLLLFYWSSIVSHKLSKSLTFTATRDISQTRGLPELFNPVASRSKYTRVFISCMAILSLKITKEVLQV